VAFKKKKRMNEKELWSGFGSKLGSRGRRQATGPRLRRHFQNSNNIIILRAEKFDFA